jgi:hypothetical protein
MPHPSKDFSDLAGQFFKPDGIDLSDAGPSCRQLRDKVTFYEERTRPFVASVFWQAFLATPSFAFFLAAVRDRHPKIQVKLLQVVPHGPKDRDWTMRFDLLVLLEGMENADEYIETAATPVDAELRDGSARFQADVAKANAKIPDGVDHAGIALEALRAHPFSILAFPAPPMIPTAYLTQGAVRVTEPQQGASSTGGVWCSNDKGQVGVTAAWHAVKQNVNGAVAVDGHRARIVSSDVLSDSAFIEVDLANPGRQANCLSNLVPRQHEPVTFNGHSSGHRAGKVTGWSPQLPIVTGNSQLVVTTGPISTPGDSGAVLQDGQGMLLGFCHETSAFGAVNPYSSWIWAELVFKAHCLT